MARESVGGTGRRPAAYLVCFAVKEEATSFDFSDDPRGPRVVACVTGMGRRNASEAIRQALSATEPERVLTCGFAGALHPALTVGTVVFDEDEGARLGSELTRLGAVSARFHCATRVAITAAEKRALHEATGADAVEMESAVIRTLCRERGIPSATVRVISDAAHDDLPLDFNEFLTPADRIHYRRLLWSVLRTPRRIPRLWAFQRQTARAAARLGTLLSALVKIGPGG
jgi:adenosylhomocysteine nucleosidase